MKKINFNKGLNYLGMTILFICLLYLLWQRSELSESLINNHDELNICKYQVNFFQTELDIRSKAIGSKLDLNLMKIENNINFKTNKNKILIFADDATCTPCFHETIGLILNQRNESVDSDIVVILIVGSRNQNYTKKLCEKYLHELPVYSDSNFLLKKKFNLDTRFTSCFLLDEDDNCLSSFLFKKGDEFNNYIKSKVILKITKLLN